MVTELSTCFRFLFLRELGKVALVLFDGFHLRGRDKQGNQGLDPVPVAAKPWSNNMGVSSTFENTTIPSPRPRAATIDSKMPLRSQALLFSGGLAQNTCTT